MNRKKDKIPFDVEKYLFRINFKALNLNQDLNTLSSLQTAHLQNVPYENLDIFYHREFNLSHLEVYRKIVEENRGGYCFELNGLFAWLLRQLGFKTEEYLGRWLYGEPLAVPMRRHRVVKVFLPEGEFITDVGVGRMTPLTPFSCQLDIPQQLNGRIYRMVADPVHGKIIQIQDNDSFVNYFSFDEAPQQDIDFTYPHYFCTHHPSSPFLQQLMVHRQTPHGRVSIASVPNPESGIVTPLLSLSEPDGSDSKIWLFNDDQLMWALDKFFDIKFNPQTAACP